MQYSYRSLNALTVKATEGTMLLKPGERLPLISVTSWIRSQLVRKLKSTVC